MFSLEGCLYSSNYLGQKGVFSGLIDLFTSTSDLCPSRWQIDDKKRHVFAASTLASLEKEWVNSPAGRLSSITFLGSGEIRFRLFFSLMKNSIRDVCLLSFSSEQIQSELVQNRIVDLVESLSSVCSCDYGFLEPASHATRGKVSILMDRVHWLNIFGAAYIDMLEKARLLNCPNAVVRELLPALISVRLSGPLQFDSPRPPDFGQEVLDHLGPQHFLGPNPTFDTSSRAVRPSKAETADARTERTRREFIQKGYRVISESATKLAFAGEDGSIAELDLLSGSITVKPNV